MAGAVDVEATLQIAARRLFLANVTPNEGPRRLNLLFDESLQGLAALPEGHGGHVHSLAVIGSTPGMQCFALRNLHL